MRNLDYRKPWYHGSAFRLKALRKGTTIIQDCQLARIFSHKPTLVSASETEIKHDGKISGLLYRVAEKIKPGDVTPHPHSSMEEGKEWLTTRELKVELICLTRVVEKERLTLEDVEKLKKRIHQRNRTK